MSIQRRDATIELLIKDNGLVSASLLTLFFDNRFYKNHPNHFSVVRREEFIVFYTLNRVDVFTIIWFAIFRCRRFHHHMVCDIHILMVARLFRNLDF